MRRAFVLLAVVALVGSGLFVGGSLASYQPEEYCGLCGPILGPPGEHNSGFTAEHDVPPDIRESSLTIQVHENGTSTWTERAVLEPETAALVSSNERLRRELVTYARSDDSVYETQRGTSKVVDDTLVFTYQVENVSTDGVGDVVLVDYFHEEPGENENMWGRLVVRPPPGTEITNRPPGATLTNGSAVWTDGRGPPAQTYIAYAPAGDDAGLETALSIAFDIGPRMFNQALVFGAPISIVWVLVGIGLTLRMGSRQDVLVPWSTASGEAGDSPVSEPGEADRSIVASPTAVLLLGWAFLLAIPISMLFSLELLWVLAVGAQIAFWLSLGMAERSRQWWGSLLGLVIVPILFLLPLTPVAGVAQLMLIFSGIVPGMLWILVGIALFWLGRKHTADSNTPSESVD